MRHSAVHNHIQLDILELRYGQSQQKAWMSFSNIIISLVLALLRSEKVCEIGGFSQSPAQYAI